MMRDIISVLHYDRSGSIYKSYPIAAFDLVFRFFIEYDSSEPTEPFYYGMDSAYICLLFCLYLYDTHKQTCAIRISVQDAFPHAWNSVDIICSAFTDIHILWDGKASWL
jgi:hypothetical protein